MEESQDVVIKTNKYQTPITKELLSSLEDEVREQFLDAVNNIQFIKNLISPNRPYHKDLPRDERGRAIVDITNPPIMVDSDYFRKPALHYMKEKCYTFLKPNSNPNSEFRKFWDREKLRCWNGYLRPEDGAWISGYEYWFLNYTPMLVNFIEDGKKKAIRKESFPFFFEGIDWRFKYLYDSRELGHHAIELAKRGCGKSVTLASIMSHNLILGESEESHNRVITVLTAYQKEYLSDSKDGTLSKFKPAINFSFINTPFPRLLLKNSPNEMAWQMGYKDEYGIERGTLNLVLGVSAKDDADKLRGKRGWILYEEMGTFANLLSLYDVTRRSVEDGDYTFACQYLVGTANDSESDFASAKTLLYNTNGYNITTLPNVYDKPKQGKSTFGFFFPAYVNRAGCYNKDGVSDVVKALIEIFNARYKAKYGADPKSVLRVIAEDPITPAEAIIKVKATFFPVQALNERLSQLDADPRAYDDVYIGRLSIDKSGNVKFTPTDDKPIRNYGVANDTLGALEIYTMPEKNKDGSITQGRYIIGCLLPSEAVITDEGLKSIKDVTLNNKLVSIDGNYVDIIEKQSYNVKNEDIYKITINGIYDPTIFTKEHPIYACTPVRKYHNTRVVKRSNVPYAYREFNFSFKKVEDLKVGDYVKIPNIYSKNITIPFNKWDNTNIRVDRAIDNPLGKEDFWWFIGLVLGDGWATKDGHCVNVAFNSLETHTIDKFIRVSKEVFSREVFLVKDKGSCKEYSICQSQLNKFIKDNFGVYAINKNLPEWVKFLPINLKGALIKGYIDSDGYVNSKTIEIISVSKKLLNDFQDIIYSLEVASSVTLLRRKKKAIITNKVVNQQETYHLRIHGSYVKKLISKIGLGGKLNKFDLSKEWDKRTIKECIFEDEYILKRISKIEHNTYTGTVYNFHCESNTFMCNYIPTHNCDPVDNDQAESSSLFSTFVLDTWTDKLVAEYTGRQPFADDNFEIVRLLCLFYNARCLYESNRKGQFAYFQRLNCIHLLAETPEYLRDKQLVKYSAFGSNAYGVNASAGINEYGFRLIRDWLLKPCTVINKENGNEVEVQVPNLAFLKNRALIEELVSFNMEMNFDRVHALKMVMLYREEKLILYQGDPRKGKEVNDANYLGNDKFFSDNFDNRQ